MVEYEQHCYLNAMTSTNSVSICNKKQLASEESPYAIEAYVLPHEYIQYKLTPEEYIQLHQTYPSFLLHFSYSSCIYFLCLR